MKNSAEQCCRREGGSHPNISSNHMIQARVSCREFYVYLRSSVLWTCGSQGVCVCIHTCMHRCTPGVYVHCGMDVWVDDVCMSGGM